MSREYSLVGVDGNAFSVMGYVSDAMRECGMKKEDIDNYQIEAMSGDYNNLLAVSCEMLDRLNTEVL